MSISIIQATTAADYQAFAALVREYVQWCRKRYQDDVWFVDQAFGHQSLEREVLGLADAYGAANGKAFLAHVDGQMAGIIAHHRLADGSCEMKRMFVSERFQGHGVGRKLCEAVIASARADGFTLMRLDTTKLFVEAIGLYKSFGFRECPPHLEYPENLKPYILFMELPLGGELAHP